MSKAKRVGKKIMVTMTATGFRFCRFNSTKHTIAADDPDTKVMRIPSGILSRLDTAQKEAGWLHTKLVKLWQEDNDHQKDPEKKKRTFNMMSIFQTSIKCDIANCDRWAVAEWIYGNKSITKVCEHHHHKILDGKPC